MIATNRILKRPILLIKSTLKVVRVDVESSEIRSGSLTFHSRRLHAFHNDVLIVIYNQKSGECPNESSK